MEIFCYNKGTNERIEQKMFISFKKKRGRTDEHVGVSRQGTARSRRDTAKEKRKGGYEK